MNKTVIKTNTTLIALSVGLIFSVLSGLTAAESATIKNGLACNKLGQKSKVGDKRYVCGKNPYVTPTKLTWMLSSCPQAYDLYVDAKDQFGIFKDVLSTSPEGIAELRNLQNSMDSLDILMRTQVCKKGK